MKILKGFLLLFFIVILSSCLRIKKEKTEVNRNDSIERTPSANNNTEFGKDKSSVTTIKFDDITVFISKFIVYDEKNKLSTNQKDTVCISADIGETIEGQLINIETSTIKNLKVEQRYETSITIMNEGPHCDLTEWKHYDSEWKQLKTKNNLFECIKYTNDEQQKFPEINIEKLKSEIKSKCGKDWFELVKNIKSPIEYPCEVGISKYFLRITGENATNGVKIAKLIEIDVSLGD